MDHLTRAHRHLAENHGKHGKIKAGARRRNRCSVRQGLRVGRYEEV